jgi:erythromycin esterase-like protein
MGMFSWACKGCGHDLKEGELVRMNGCRGLYNGYGGNSGGFDHENCDGRPVCWHERCYKRANTAERDDDTPSTDASNQGFGHPALEFLKGYDEKAETTHKVVISTTTGTYPDTKRHRFHIVREGQELVLRDRVAYEETWTYWDSGEKFPDNYFEMTEEEQNARDQRLHERFEAETGLKDPELNAVSFASLEEAKKAADLLLKDIAEYHLVILGEQGKLHGQCYERERHMKYLRVDGKRQPTGKYREEVFYEQGVPNKDQKNRLSVALFGDE